MQLITFLTEFIKHPKYTGVVVPSSKILAKKMVDVIDFNKVKCIDYVLSGLPFTSLPEEVSKRILNNAMEAIHENGEFITFQYSLVKNSKESVCIIELHELLFYTEQYGYWALFF